MTKIPTWAKAALLALLALLALSAPAASKAADRPNFLFLLADDMGWADLGCYGSTFHRTPAIDNMARQGKRFTTFYSAGSVCSPTRSSIMTGKYPVRTGVTDWIPGQNVSGRKLVQLHPTALALEETTIAEGLKAGGYQTAYVGKWHLGGKGLQPTDQGFDTYEGFEGSEESGASDRGDRLKRRLESTHQFTKFALKFLEQRDKSRPFLLFVSYHDVHTPIQPMPGFVEDYEARARKLEGTTPIAQEHEGKTRMRQDNPAYGSMMSAVDSSVARLREQLRTLNLESNTIVIFTSDNGGLSTQRNPGPTSNLPLRAGKGWLYEGGIRVPLIIVGPGVANAGSVSDTPLITCDFFPTLLEMAGLSPQPQAHLDGTSFAGLIMGDKQPTPRTFYWHYPHYHGSTWTPGGALREGEWKLVEFFEQNQAEIYNLKNDPGEQKDLSASEPVRKQELLEKLHRWQRALNARIPGPETASDPARNPRVRKARARL